MSGAGAALRSRVLGLLALVAAGAGCAAVDRALPRAPTPSTDEGEWAQRRDAASRGAELYDGLDRRAAASATWLSAPVREALARRLAAWQAWSPEELNAELARARIEAAQGEDFVVAFYAADQVANDLDSPRSVWRIEIDDGSRRVAAAKVSGVRADATIVQLYPYVGTFDVVYRVHVPWGGAPLEGRPFTLRIASAYGRLDLDFGPGGTPALRPHLFP